MPAMAVAMAENIAIDVVIRIFFLPQCFRSRVPHPSSKLHPRSPGNFVESFCVIQFSKNKASIGSFGCSRCAVGLLRVAGGSNGGIDTFRFLAVCRLSVRSGQIIEVTWSRYIMETALFSRFIV